jgi:alkanesulfonate monooxygenase SsuD/methylene tetrahydromethanopterin reductase-like flavin-dependent oxidoreductase (luciferase family)
MEIGIGLDQTLGLSYDEQADVSAEAAKLGYTQIWTPETGAEDAFLTCVLRWQATREALPGGVTTGIAVSPVGLRTPMGLAMSAGSVSNLTGGRFILGIGAGQAQSPQYRRTWGLRGSSVLGLMRDYILTMKALLAGETVEYDGPSISYHGARLGIQPPQNTPAYLGALGPEMLRLGGEVADGVSLNWCSTEQVAWSRERVAEGASKSGRDASSVKVAEYIRICVDEDEDVARRAYTRNLMGYALGFGPPSPPGTKSQGYRAHFERMGFTDDLDRLDDMRRANAPTEEVVDAFPEALLKAVGYYGPASGAAASFRALSAGLDIAIVRVISARPGDIEATRVTMLACAPGGSGK